MNELSIFIPTYNRPQKLLNTLLRLSDQISETITIYVLDNASDEDLESYCSQNMKINQFITQNKIIFIRHKNNIGMSANFLRAFELCNTEWMWLIADDDQIHENVTSKINKTINDLKNSPEVAFIKFKSNDCCDEINQVPTYVRSIEDFISILSKSKDWFNSYIFITNGLYRMKNFRNRLEIGYKYLNTYVPHLIMLLDELYWNKDSCIYVTEYSVVNYEPPKIGYSYAIVAGLGVGAFKNFNYNLGKKNYMQLEKIFAAHNDYKVSIDIFYYTKYSSNLFVMQKLINNYYLQIKDSRSIFHNICYKTFNKLIMFPSLFEFLLRILRRYSNNIDTHITEMIERYNR